MVAPVIAAAGSVALRQGIPMATAAFAKYFPSAVKTAKDMVGKSIGRDASKINLEQVSREGKGMFAQVVAESMVKSGMPADAIFSHIDQKFMAAPELVEYRRSLVALQKSEEAESDAKVLGPHITLPAVALMDEKMRSIRFLMRVFGTSDPKEVWTAKVELDHLSEIDIQAYELLRASASN